MRLIRKKEQETALMRITALQTIINHLLSSDPAQHTPMAMVDHMTYVTKHLVELAYTVGGISGMNKVKNSVEKWSEKNG